MSKAFTKEDDTPPERSVRKRASTGLPPGAPNYMTADGARRFRTELASLKDAESERANHLRMLLASASIVEPPSTPPEGAVFGAKVTVRAPDGHEQIHRIVGVDEVYLEPDFVSWTSPNGRALLGAEHGQRVMLETNGASRKFTIVRIDY